MISIEKLIKLARKWKKITAIKRKRITFPLTSLSPDHGNNCSKATTAEKGHFVVYTIDQRRFMLPLDYLNKQIVKELFTLAEEEFGLPTNGPLTLPCDSAFMEYVITLIRRNVTIEVQKALLVSISSDTKCLSSLCSYLGVINQQLPICGF